MTDLKVFCRKCGVSIEEVASAFGYTRRGFYKLYERKPEMVRCAVFGLVVKRLIK